MRKYLHPSRAVGLNKQTAAGGIGPVDCRGETKKYKVRTLYSKLYNTSRDQLQQPSHGLV